MNISVFTLKYKSIVRSLLTPLSIKSCLGKEFIDVKGLWDTGANHSCISEVLAKKLNLIPTGMRAIKTPSGESIQSTYCVDLYLPNKIFIKGLPVCDSKINNQGFDILIGMDVISMGDFSISNFNNKTYFSFRMPSIEHIDYVHQIRLSNLIGPLHKKM